jgi:hypothetical protein
VIVESSWFHFNWDDELRGLRPDDKMPDHERRTVQCENWIWTLVETPNGFHLTNLLPTGFIINVADVITHVHRQF